MRFHTELFAYKQTIRIALSLVFSSKSHRSLPCRLFDDQGCAWDQAEFFQRRTKIYGVEDPLGEVLGEALDFAAHLLRDDRYDLEESGLDWEGLHDIAARRLEPKAGFGVG